ncbi:electron transfer flavoprotein subunit beta/FixA family protein [Derxia lacustris]|uniref:electron transfer flavoprotein subunit beta/FixA family protein n=1 Tax=Derxia lacustris TaxID=764842 RepID=UPI001F19A64C|nr:electron transfer flavoprotein subunit beta/FixA family protein [Derxia lacustris]
MADARIAVLVSVERHPVSGAWRRNRNDAAALALGLRLVANGAARLDVIHAGDAANPALRDYLALGAGKVEVIALPAGADALPALAARLRGVDLVLCGSAGDNGLGSGMLPYLLGAALGCAVLPQALEVELKPGGIEALQFLPKGRRRRVAVQGPAIVAVHPLAGGEPRWSHARAVAGSVVASAAVGAQASAWQPPVVEAATRKPRRLKPVDRRSGHARMSAAVDTAGAGGQVVSDGTSVEKAQVLLRYLGEHGLRSTRT